MLRVQDIEKTVNGKKIIKNISLHVGNGEIVGLLGPNGAGKSTTFRLLTGILRPDAGTVMLNGVDVTRMPFHMRAQYGLAYLPQTSFLPRTLSVQNTLDLILETRLSSRKERVARRDALLDEFSLEDVRHRRTALLSGGQRRRCEIAVCMACDPVIALFDEPFAGVDPLNTGTVTGLLRHLADKGLSVLITDHSAMDILRLVDRAYVVESGRVLAEGDPATLSQDPDVRRVYLGEGNSL